MAFVPAGPHNGYASGGWVRPDGFQELFDGFRFHFGLVSTAPGADPQAVVDRLADNGVSVEPGPIIAPLERSELAELETVPLVLAGFLALLGIGAVAHTLASTARRRRHDIAMLRALGMRPRNSGAIVFVQAGAIAVVGLVIGLSLGIALGRVGLEIRRARHAGRVRRARQLGTIAVDRADGRGAGCATRRVAVAALAYPRSRRRTALRMSTWSGDAGTPEVPKVTPLPPRANSAPLEAMDVITGSDAPTGHPQRARSSMRGSTADSTTPMPAVALVGAGIEAI